jgi:hypothetical protein
MKQKRVGSPWLLEHFRGALRRRRFWTQLRIEDWWQDRLILPPHRAPSRKFIDAMNDAFEYDANGYSAEAQQLWQAWTQEDPISISARIGNSLSARLRLRTIRVKGQRIRIDDEERRMMAWTMAEGSLYIRFPSVDAAAILAAPGFQSHSLRRGTAFWRKNAAYHNRPRWLGWQQRWNLMGCLRRCTLSASILPNRNCLIMQNGSWKAAHLFTSYSLIRRRASSGGKLGALPHSPAAASHIYARNSTTSSWS